MTDSTGLGVTLAIVGVLLIVIGGAMVLNGYDKIQAANEWDENVGCAYDYRSQAWICPTNPYEGGRSQFWTGLAVTIVGGIVLYFGTR